MTERVRPPLFSLLDAFGEVVRGSASEADPKKPHSGGGWGKDRKGAEAWRAKPSARKPERLPLQRGGDPFAIRKQPKAAPLPGKPETGAPAAPPMEAPPANASPPLPPTLKAGPAPSQAAGEPPAPRPQTPTPATRQVIALNPSIGAGQAEPAASYWEGGVAAVSQALAREVPPTKGAQAFIHLAAAQVRLAKFIKVGNEFQIVIYLGDFRGTPEARAPAFVEIRNTFNAALPFRLGRSPYNPSDIERNLVLKLGRDGPKVIQNPETGAIKKSWSFEYQRNGGGTFGEWIDGRNTLVGKDFVRVIFPSEKEATRFVDEWSAKSNYFQAYNSLAGVKGEFEAAYFDFAKRHFPSNFPPQRTGSTQSIGYSGWMRLYISSDLTALAPKDLAFFSKQLPELASKIGPAMAFGGAKSAGIFLSNDWNFFMNAVRSKQVPNNQIGSTLLFHDGAGVQGDEGSSSALESYGFELGVNTKLLAGLFLPHKFEGELHENGVSAGAVLHLDPAHNGVQMSLNFHYTHGGLTSESQHFHPLYWNMYPGGSRVGLGTAQGGIAHLRTIKEATEVEVRLPLTGGGADENLQAAYVNRFRKKSLKECFADISELYAAKGKESPFTPNWERNARSAFQEIYMNGASVDDEFWDSVVKHNLAPPFWDLPIYQTTERMKWNEQYFTKAHMDAYKEYEEEIKAFGERKLKEIKALAFAEKYRLFYSEFNLLYPNMVYIRKNRSAGDLWDHFAGAAIVPPADPKGKIVSAIANNRFLKDSVFGLHKAWWSEEDAHRNLIVNLAIDLDHFRQYKTWHEEDPALGEAIDFLYNRYGYRRTDDAGKFTPRSPITHAYFGFTDTPTIEALQLASGQRLDISGKQIYKVREEDIVHEGLIKDGEKTWAKLAESALKQLGYHDVPPPKLKAYENLLWRVNFSKLPDQQNLLEHYIFPDALLALPSYSLLSESKG
jgi:hypothetical protein